MRSKVTVVLLFLNVVLFFYIYQYEKVQLPDANGRRVLGAEVASIDSLTRTSSNPAVASLKLERRGETWSLVEPYEWPANPHAVDRLVKELQFLEHETSFAVADLAKSGQTMADYGLDQPTLTLTFTSAKKPYTLKIGNVTEIGKRLYVLSPDGARIHVVGRSLADSIGLSLEDLRSESIFTVPVFEVRSLNVQTAAPNLKVRLRRDASGRWGFETPINARANKTAVVVTINTLNALTAKKFLDPRETDLDRAGLSSPALRVTLEGNARRETLLLGNADTADQYFAKIEDKPNVFTTAVPAALLETLRTAQEQLRDPRVLDFEPGTVTALTLGAPGQPELSLQRLEGGTGATVWQVVTRISGQAPLTMPADLALVEELLQKLYLLAAKKFQSDAPSAAELEKYGFNRPERTIVLGLSTGGGPRGDEASSLNLEIGVSPNEREVAYARVTNAQFVYQILPDILAETPTLARYYRQRLLRELPASARLTGLTLTDLATNTALYQHHLAETDGNWDGALAAEPEARRKPLTALLGALRFLRAKNFTAESFTPEHADTAQGAQPWRYRLDFNLAFAGGTGPAQAATTTLYLTERLGGSTLLAGTADFGGVQFEVTQEMLDALFFLTYAEKHDPGVGGPAPAAVEVKKTSL
ncbi:MAG: DUF4340 domain-containing protein [Opitutae bacterium]